MFKECFTSVLKMFQSCLFALKSSQLPMHKEGLLLHERFLEELSLLKMLAKKVIGKKNGRVNPGRG